MLAFIWLGVATTQNAERTMAWQRANEHDGRLVNLACQRYRVAASLHNVSADLAEWAFQVGYRDMADCGRSYDNHGATWSQMAGRPPHGCEACVSVA